MKDTHVQDHNGIILYISFITGVYVDIICYVVYKHSS